MSLASDARRLGFMALLAASGESLTYDESDATLSAIVNRAEMAIKPAQMPQFNVKDETKIELLKTAMAETPAVGKAFYDDFGHAYRIETVKRGEWTYLCTCKGSDVPAE